jgi:hypothetical protein
MSVNYELISYSPGKSILNIIIPVHTYQVAPDKPLYACQLNFATSQDLFTFIYIY